MKYLLVSIILTCNGTAATVCVSTGLASTIIIPKVNNTKTTFDIVFVLVWIRRAAILCLIPTDPVAACSSPGTITRKCTDTYLFRRSSITDVLELYKERNNVWCQLEM